MKSSRNPSRGSSCAKHPELFIDLSEAATAAAAAGLGVVSTGAGSVQAEVEAGVLVRLLPDWEIGASDIHVILPAGRAAKASARAFADFIVAEVREINSFSLKSETCAELPRVEERRLRKGGAAGPVAALSLLLGLALNR